MDAVYKAINRIVDVPNQLTEFSIKSVTEGIDALGEVTIRIESEDQSFIGRGAHTDIIVASAKAYMNALNRLIASREESTGGRSRRLDRLPAASDNLCRWRSGWLQCLRTESRAPDPQDASKK